MTMSSTLSSTSKLFEFNMDAYCSSATDSAVLIDCAIYNSIPDTSGINAGINAFFLLYAGALVFFMQAGFAMLCAGSVRCKNVKNVMLKNLLDACGGALGFWSIGFAFAYGGDNLDKKTFIGHTYFFLHDYDDYITFFFQFAFAATAATIVAGTVAERCKMAAYLSYSLFLTGFVYPVIVHSIWSSNGFLSAFREEGKFRDVGMVDFAGSGVVHMTGGATALIAAIVLGPRMGRFHDQDGYSLDTPADFKGHSAALQMLGTFILWFGWYGFNPGSALTINSEDNANTVALCAVTTTIAAAAGCVTSMFLDTFIEFMTTGDTTYDLSMAMNGLLGGLVSITAGCSVVTTWAAFLIGAIAGVVYFFCSKLLLKLKIDDVVDAIPVHLANGLWGVIAVGLFADPNLMNTAGYNTNHPGFFYGGDGNLLLAQFCGILWIISWVSMLMVPFFLVLKKFNMFRVDPMEEKVGLDITHHHGAAYDLSGPQRQYIEELIQMKGAHHGNIDIPDEAPETSSHEANKVADKMNQEKKI